MITVSVSAFAAGSRFPTLGVEGYWNPGSTTGPVQYYSIPSILLGSSTASEDEAFAFDIGYLRPDLSKGPMGRLKDKGVTHLNAQGDLVVAARSYVHGRVSINVGTPNERIVDRAKRTGVASYTNFRAVIDWGTDLTENYTCVWSPNVDSQGTFTRDADEYLLDTWFEGDLCYLTSSQKQGAVYKNGVFNSAVSYVNRFALIKREGSTLRLLKGTTNLSSLPRYATRAEFKAAAAPFVNLTGTVISMTNYDSASVSGSPSGIAQAVADRVASFHGFRGLVKDESAYFDFGDMSLECAEQMKYVDANLMMAVIDINEWRNFHTFVKSAVNSQGWKRALRAFDKAKRLKGSSWNNFLDMFTPGTSLYLFQAYAVQPTISDGKAIFEGVRKLISEPTSKRLHSRRVLPVEYSGADSGQLTAVLTVEVGAYPNGLTGKIQELIGEAKRWGVYPNCTALADLVKYSFVVNWFVKFGDVLKDVDAYLDVENYFPVHHCICSVKWAAGYSATVVVPDTYLVTGQVVYSHYRRWVTTQVPLPAVDPLRLGSNPFKHGVEMFSLVLQRLPRSLR